MFSNNNNRLGKLIVVEGTDGSGKTTTCKKLSDYINDHPEEFDGYTAMTLSLPYNDGSEIYKKIRELLTIENYPTDILQSLMILNMRDTFNNIIAPKLENEKIIIILDRWLLSTLVYNIMNKGNIFDSAVKHICLTQPLNCTRSGYKDLGVPFRKLFLDIDEFSSYYCGLNVFPDKVYLLSPGIGMLRKHCIVRRKSDDDQEVNDKFENVMLSNSIYNNLFDYILGIDRKDRDDRYNLFDRAHFRSTYEKIFLMKYSASDNIPSMFEEEEFYSYVQDFLKRRVKNLIQG